MNFFLNQCSSIDRSTWRVYCLSLMRPLPCNLFKSDNGLNDAHMQNLGEVMWLSLCVNLWYILVSGAKLLKLYPDSVALVMRITLNQLCLHSQIPIFSYKNVYVLDRVFIKYLINRFEWRALGKSRINTTLPNPTL